MRRAMLLVAIALLAGCDSDPELRRLKTGQEALAFDKHEAKVPMSGIPQSKGVAGFDIGFVLVGTKLRVIEDAGNDLEEFPGQRKVDVVPLEGEFEGVAGKIYRKNLRPIDK